MTAMYGGRQGSRGEISEPGRDDEPGRDGEPGRDAKPGRDDEPGRDNDELNELLTLHDIVLKSCPKGAWCSKLWILAKMQNHWLKDR